MLYKIEDFLLFFCYNNIGDNMDNNVNADLETRVLELEKKVKKIETIYRRNLIFKIITLIATLIILGFFFYIIFNYYTEVLGSF